jgi:hypothetical protein
MDNSNSVTRPWYQIRWQLILTALVTILLSAYLHYQLSKPLEISVTSGPTGQDKTLKQRMVFLDHLEKDFRKKGWPASFYLEGEDGKTLKISWARLKRPFVKQMVQNPDIIADFREIGFKILVFKNGTNEWDVDLRN